MVEISAVTILRTTWRIEDEWRGDGATSKRIRIIKDYMKNNS
jgi:hypothetical protein